MVANATGAGTRHRSAPLRALLPVSLAAGLLALAIGLVPTAAAEPQTGQLAVTATVLSGCALTGGTLDFGTYIAGQSAARDASGQIGFVNCSGLLTFELDGGQNGNVNTRRMSGTGGTLNYQIYTTSSRTSIWGTGANAYQLQLLGTPPRAAPSPSTAASPAARRCRAAPTRTSSTSP
jgi:spore coat protein U-like protein